MDEKVLVTDDEEAIRELVKVNLQRAGYSVVTAATGSECLDTLRQERPHLVILDIMLPDIDGFSVYHLLRKESKAAVIFLTARDDEMDRVMGLELGADDYVTKPFSPRELLARVRAVLRRCNENNDLAPGQTGLLVSNNLTVDLHRHEARLNGLPIALTPKEFALLSHFIDNRGQAFSRNQLLDQIWGESYFGDTRIVDVHVRHLREKIETDPSHPARIITVRGVGYRFDG